MLGSCLVSFHFLWAILCPQAVFPEYFTHKTPRFSHAKTEKHADALAYEIAMTEECTFVFALWVNKQRLRESAKKRNASLPKIQS